MHVGKAKLDAVASATRFTPAIVAVENEDEGDDEVHPRVLVSFFSTSTCNMTSCGMFSDVSSFITEKTRGKGMYQRKWFTENNTHRKFYLSAFSPRVLTIPAAVYGVPHDRPHRIRPPYPPPPQPHAAHALAISAWRMVVCAAARQARTTHKTASTASSCATQCKATAASTGML